MNLTYLSPEEYIEKFGVMFPKPERDTVYKRVLFVIGPAGSGKTRFVNQITGNCPDGVVAQGYREMSDHTWIVLLEEANHADVRILLKGMERGKYGHAYMPVFIVVLQNCTVGEIDEVTAEYKFTEGVVVRCEVAEDEILGEGLRNDLENVSGKRTVRALAAGDHFAKLFEVEGYQVLVTKESKEGEDSDELHEVVQHTEINGCVAKQRLSFHEEDNMERAFANYDEVYAKRFLDGIKQLFKVK